MVKSLSAINHEFETAWNLSIQDGGQAAAVTPIIHTGKKQNVAERKNTKAKSAPPKPAVSKPQKKRAIDAQTVVIAKTKPKKTVISRISDVLFYLGILFVLVMALFYGTNRNGPIVLFGHSFMTVLTGSMQDVIPKGSIVINKQVPLNALNIGDDITFMRDEQHTITHRIIDIFENYDNSGERGFQTQGVNNNNPDSDIVYGGNVIGKVIYHMPAVGATLSFLCDNLYIVFIMFGLFIVLSFALKGLFSKEGDIKQPNPNIGGMKIV